MKKTVTLLGSTGSVGLNTLRVIEEHPQRFQVAGLAAGTRADLLEKQIRTWRPRAVYLKGEDAARRLRQAWGERVAVFTETEGLEAFSRHLDSDILVAASSGTSGLLAVIGALERGRRVALANKEILVVAGKLVMSKLRQNPRAALLPVDSEHSAIFQCLLGSSREDVRKLVLTGSGGPLREVGLERFAGVSKESVVNHPRWKMGRKISVDSATLMNKGLEMIEASCLFGIPIERIEVLIHPEAVIHSMVEFKDGALLAQLGVTDMRLPIQYALSYPGRLESHPAMSVDFSAVSRLTFSLPDRKKFPCLDLAYEAARQSGSAPCVLSAADEVAVEAYLDDRIDFVEIPRVIEKVLSSHRRIEEPDLFQIQTIHAWAVEEARRVCQTPSFL